MSYSPAIIFSAVLVLASQTAIAGPLIFDFSFSNDPNLGSAEGPITGEILGLSDDATGPASAVIITGFGSGWGSALQPPELNALGTPWTASDNEWTVQGGVVTQARFTAELVSRCADTDCFDLWGLSLTLSDTNTTATFSYRQLTADVVTLNDTRGTTSGAFAAREHAVPAPATLALFGLGLAGIGLNRRKRKAH